MTYMHLGPYSDMFPNPPFPAALPGPETVRLVRETLGFCDRPEQPQDVRIDTTWENDGLRGEAVSWSVGYGPRCEAWLLRPTDAAGPLPGVLALHDHGGFKYYGKEKIAEGPETPSPILRGWFQTYYGGRAWANALARRGFAVLVPDTFLWGSRKFSNETMLASMQGRIPGLNEAVESLDEIALHSLLCGQHEHLVSKYCNLLGSSLAGVVNYEDRVALNYLRSRADVQAENTGCIGLSGGGNRSALLRASADGLKAAAIVGLMCTYEGMLDHNVVTHTWMLFPFGWARHGDWPDLAACRAPLPLLVQYDRDDDLFTLRGMRDAHEKLQERYASAGAPEAYTGQFYPGPHKFDLEMQESAFDWLERWLKDAPSGKGK